MAEKTVLVYLKDRARLVNFMGGLNELTDAIKRTYNDVFLDHQLQDSELFLQVGAWVNGLG